MKLTVRAPLRKLISAIAATLAIGCPGSSEGTGAASLGGSDSTGGEQATAGASSNNSAGASSGGITAVGGRNHDGTDDNAWRHNGRGWSHSSAGNGWRDCRQWIEQPHLGRYECHRRHTSDGWCSSNRRGHRDGRLENLGRGHRSRRINSNGWCFEHWRACERGGAPNTGGTRATGGALATGGASSVAGASSCSGTVGTLSGPLFDRYRLHGHERPPC